jgi:hypothetical protein
MNLFLWAVVFVFNVQGVNAQAGATYPGTKDGVQRYYSSHGGYSPTACRIDNCNPAMCQPDEYLFNCGGNTAGTCTKCTNLKPANSDWESGTTGVYSATGCKWVCQTNYKLKADGTGCEIQACAEQSKPAILNSVYVSGPDGQVPNCNYQCVAGYAATGTATARGPGQCTACTAGQTSVAGGACTDCGEGLFSANPGSSVCSECKAAERKYSKGTKNTGCIDCTSCGQGEYRTGCGGSQGPGECPSCTNTNWP